MDEKNYQDLIKQAQEILYCPTCGRTYQLDEIRLRGFVDDKLVLQVICSNGHAPVSTIVFTATSGGKLPQRVKAAPRKKITKDDVLDLHQALKGFDGDFKNLWGKS